MLRVLVNREKFEEALFKWPPQYFDEDNRMILPRGKADTEYLHALQIAMSKIADASAIIEKGGIDCIDSFKTLWLNKKACPTIKEYAQSANSRQTIKDSSRMIYEGQARAIISIIGNKRLDEIKEADLHAIDSAYIEAEQSPCYIHILLNKYLKQAVVDGFIQESPYRKFKSAVQKKRSKMEMRIRSEAVEDIWRHFIASEGSMTERKSAQLFLLQCFTGARYSDANKITIQDIEKGFYVSQKSGTVCPLVKSDRLLLLAKDLPISIDYFSYRYSLKKISATLGHDYSHSHDARRYFASKLNEQTSDLMVVKQALGHSSLSMTERYVTPNSQKLKDAIKKLGEI